MFSNSVRCDLLKIGVFTRPIRQIYKIISTILSELLIKNSFVKELKKVPPKTQTAIKGVLYNLREAHSLENSGLDYKPMEGQRKGEHYYQIQVGEWRIGIDYTKPKVVVITVLSRGNIYKHFPPK